MPSMEEMMSGRVDREVMRYRDVKEQDAPQKKSIAKKQLLERLNKCAIGGNHLANYLLNKNIFPETIKTHEEAMKKLDNLDYEVWCSWNAIRQAIDGVID